MDLVQDFIIEDGDLVFEDGDIKVAESDRYHIADILQASKGSYRNSPTLGVNILLKIAGNANPEFLKREIRQQLESDGYQIDELEVSKTHDEMDVTINATRVK